MDIETYRNILLNDALQNYNTKLKYLKNKFAQEINSKQLTRILFERLSQKHNNDVSKLISDYKFQANKIKHLVLAKNILNNSSFYSSASKKALLVGINYRNKPNTLFGCINDVILMESQLRAKYGFSSFKILTDDTDIKPTKTNIMNELTSLFNSGNAGDTVVVHFSGHGTTGNFVTLDGFIRKDELYNIINSNMKPGVKVLLIIDCCHSGSILDLKYTWDNNNTLVVKNNNESNEQIVLLSSCSSSQVSSETYNNKQPNGAMTWSLLECLGNNSRYRWGDLMARMREVLKHSIFAQIPQISSGKMLDLNSEIFL
jgi:hypothetical protein